MSQFQFPSSSQQSKTADLAEEPFTDTIPFIGPITPLTSTYAAQNITPYTGTFPSASASVSPTQSLITALQSTMSPPSTERLVIIPGTYKNRRTRNLQEAAGPTRRMRSRVRYGIIMSAICVIFVITLVSLTPLSSDQNTIFSFVGSAINSELAQNQHGTISAHAPTITMSDTGGITGTGSDPAQAPVALPKSQYVAIARQDAIDAGISPDYFVRQINAESSFNPNAVSPFGAVGIAQFLPSTAAGLGVNPWDPISALQGAARLMANYANQYGGSYAMALAAYNAGSGNVQAAIKNCGATNWMNCLPAETQNYIRKIIYGY